MKKSKLLLFISLVVFPSVVYSSSGSSDELPLFLALGMQAFVSLHMSAFVLSPLSKMFNKDGDSKKLFWKLFIIRWIVLLFFDFFITTFIAIFDFISVFIGTFIVVPICAKVTKKTNNTTINVARSAPADIPVTNNGIVLKCVKCGNELTINHKFCDNCGEAFDGDNVKVEIAQSKENAYFKIVTQKDFDSMFSLNEESMIYEFLNRELEKAGLDKNSKLIPSTVLRKRKILNVIFSFLTFIFVCLIFFHFPLLTYISGGIILLLLYKITSSYNFMVHLKKQVKSRPSEKISNIVMNLKQTMVEDTSRKVLFLGLILSIVLPMIIFIKPMIWYEKVDGGYGVRYYIFGLTNFTSVTIPEEYNGEDVVLLRGNTFSNMPFLKEVNLPDTITEIRGQAFKNAKMLKNIKLPSNLTYLGGGAFYGCTSLEEIVIPNSVTYIGGEAFYKAKKLKRITLSENITEIKGNTFEYCRSLESIAIPDNVTRIGGHAFYGASSLTNVSISPTSKLTEIGSSAFRLCHRLYNITLPTGVYVNERAFKESPTNISFYNEYSCNQYGCSSY